MAIDTERKLSIRMSEDDMNTMNKARSVTKERLGLTLKDSDLVRYALAQIAKGGMY